MVGHIGRQCGDPITPVHSSSGRRASSFDHCGTLVASSPTAARPFQLARINLGQERSACGPAQGAGRDHARAFTDCLRGRIVRPRDRSASALLRRLLSPSPSATALSRRPARTRAPAGHFCDRRALVVFRTSHAGDFFSPPRSIRGPGHFRDAPQRPSKQLIELMRCSPEERLSPRPHEGHFLSSSNLGIDAQRRIIRRSA
jgi:hypothetical protein